MPPDLATQVRALLTGEEATKAAGQAMYDHASARMEKNCTRCRCACGAVFDDGPKGRPDADGQHASHVYQKQCEDIADAILPDLMRLVGEREGSWRQRVLGDNTLLQDVFSYLQRGVPPNEPLRKLRQDLYTRVRAVLAERKEEEK